MVPGAEMASRYINNGLLLMSACRIDSMPLLAMQPHACVSGGHVRQLHVLLPVNAAALNAQTGPTKSPCCV